MRATRMLLATAVATTALVLSSTPASAEERTCRGTLGAITVDNLRVPSGASCTLTFQNTGGVEIRGNRIDGNLQCKENSPAPIGGNNRVDGDKEDRCADL